MKHKMLIIDDSQLDIDSLQFALEPDGYSTKGTTDVDEAIAFVRQNRGRLSLAFLDVHMPGINGIELAKKLLEIDPKLQIVTYSGDRTEDTFEKTFDAGSLYFIEKGTSASKLRSIVKNFCERFEEPRKIVLPMPVAAEGLKRAAELGLTGQSNHVAETAALIDTFGPENELVLIRGENGTGKEIVARAIHAVSNRRGPFIPVNCGAIPHDLIESELFGHEKGSFSGAIKQKTGLISTANNGTLFLDEIGDLPLKLQVKLLRFLQEGEVRAVGSENDVRVNVRVIAATNVDLEEAVKEGRFREDLLYRIKVLMINLLPLRERPEDIRPLVLKFTQHWGANRTVKKDFLEETVVAMSLYKWPGNVRELENAVTRALLLAKTNVVTIKDLDAPIQATIEANDAAVEVPDHDSFKKTWEDAERKYIVETYQKAKTLRALARDYLKISNSTLQGRLKALGIVLPKQKGELQS